MAKKRHPYLRSDSPAQQDKRDAAEKTEQDQGGSTRTLKVGLTKPKKSK